MKLMNNAAAAVFVFAMLQGTVASAGVMCVGGTVTSVDVDVQGRIHASFSGLGGHLAMCSVETTANAWGVSACRALHSTLLAAQLSSKPVVVWFDALTACPASIPAWTDVTSSTYRFYHLSMQ